MSKSLIAALMPEVSQTMPLLEHVLAKKTLLWNQFQVSRAGDCCLQPIGNLPAMGCGASTAVRG